MNYSGHDAYWKKVKAMPPPLISWKEYFETSIMEPLIHGLGHSLRCYVINNRIGVADVFKGKRKVASFFDTPSALKAHCQRHEDLQNKSRT